MHCDYDKGIYIYCLVEIGVEDTVIFLQGTQFIHKATARHCDCESCRSVFLLPHRARRQAQGPMPLWASPGRPWARGWEELEIQPQPRGAGWGQNGFTPSLP